MIQRALVFLALTSCTVQTPSALNKVAYRHYEWKLGDSGNEQYRVYHLNGWPENLWRDERGQVWIERENPRRFEKW